MKILLKIPGEEKLLGIEVNEESDNILSEIKKKVVEKREGISQEQLNIYVSGVLLTDEQTNSSVLIQLKRNNELATLKILTPEQVAFYQVIKNLGLPSDAKIRRDISNDGEYLLVESKEFEEVEYLRALSKALDKSNVKSNGSDYRLNIDYPTDLPSDFAEKLKASYEEELAKIKNSLLYVSDPGGLKSSLFLMLFAALFIAVAVAINVFTGFVVLPVIFGVLAALCLGGSLYMAYTGIKMGGGGVGSVPSPGKEDTKGVEMQSLLDLDSRETQDTSYKKGVLGGQSTKTSAQKDDDKKTLEKGHTETLREKFITFINRRHF